MARHDTKYHNDLSSKADTQIQQLGALRQALVILSSPEFVEANRC